MAVYQNLTTELKRNEGTDHIHALIIEPAREKWQQWRPSTTDNKKCKQDVRLTSELSTRQLEVH